MGGSVFVLSDDDKKSATDLARSFVLNRITVSSVPTAFLEQLLDELPDKDRSSRFIHCGGEKLLHGLPRLIPGLRVDNHYGPAGMRI
jgi:non-ribosomal peptide synthetase component F